MPIRKHVARVMTTDDGQSLTAAQIATRKLLQKPAKNVVPFTPRCDYEFEALQYARNIIEGLTPANKLTLAACQRQMDDLEKAKNDPTYPYYWDPEAGRKVCRFVETLPHVKGRWAQASEKLVLQRWQIFLIVVLFSWKRKKNNKRRFRKAYWEIARKNGKSIIAAAIGLYMLCHDKEYGAEVYSGATTEKQAWEVFRPARMMALRTPELLDFFGVDVWAKMMLRPSDGSKFEPLIGNPGDGSSPSCAIIDEYHEHDTPALHDTMETGMGAREQPLILIITTAGFNIAGPCHETHDEVIKILNKVVENDEIFGVIYGIDEKDDWADPKVLAKANPNLGVSVDQDFLLSQQRQAMANPIQQTKFKTKHLNVWCSVLSGIMNMQQWNLAADAMLEEEELVGCDCWIGVDLASKLDLATEQRLYRKFFPNQEKPHFYLFGDYWLPEEAIEAEGPNQAHYRKWVITGHLTPCSGATLDFNEITEHVKASAKKINPIEVVYDPHIATQMANDLMAENIEVVEFVQTPANFTVPVDELNAAVADGRFHHDGNPITTWCFSNTVARPARKGMVAPTKQKPHQKIDGAIAGYMVMARACAAGEREPSFAFL